MNKVSIIIPVFNYGFVLENTLGNLLIQTHENWEAIIVDDGSTDNSREIVAEFIAKDRRFRYFYQENKGVSSARNLGINQATGDFYQFLDGDDLLSPAKLEVQLQHFESNPQLDISYTDSFYFFHDNPTVLQPDREMEGLEWMLKLQGRGYETVWSLIDRNIAVISSPLLKASLLQSGIRFRDGGAFLEDWEFWLKLAFAGFSFHYLKHEDAFTSIRLHNRSVSNKHFKSMEEEVLTLRTKIDGFIMKSHFNPEERQKLVAFNRDLFRGNFKRLIYHVGLLEFEKLKRLKEHLSTAEFLKYYAKSINHHRKELFKSLIKRFG
ncbi:glycosyltransferase family 2 protein [Algoriphagus resistens]|uniref:glycosyltransferase family 2 protein n=1 Tax=Algoriphagus resistens TaxID=1750590 RepID=UPI0007167DFD|nr:glycosyltransferase family 2 protein [Algoriphagus resistens]